MLSMKKVVGKTVCNIGGLKSVGHGHVVAEERMRRVVDKHAPQAGWRSTRQEVNMKCLTNTEWIVGLVCLDKVFHNPLQVFHKRITHPKFPRNPQQSLLAYPVVVIDSTGLRVCFLPTDCLISAMHILV